MKVYLVYSNPCCEDEETCSCHWTAKDLEGVYLDKTKAEKIASTIFGGFVEEKEVIL